MPDEGDALEGDSEEEAAEPLEEEALSPPGAGAGAAAAVPPEPPRKSVTYQPEPLSWKPAAVTCFLNAGAPQFGHTVSGASEIFCRTSLACPQDSHL